ncbi:MAG: thiamine-phosphate kinase [Chloroflexi bacterium RBG_16_50_9]|nr:MAG: thiamine-phosphate kinase [Chloroflexi bacterium RBG_16_50_9]
MKVAELGEFGLIDLLARMISDSQNNRFAPHKKLIVGIGDDAAAWHCDNSIQLATVDSLMQDVHFSLSTTSWQELGWKSLAVNISDIAAMGGVPTYVLVALALPGATEIENVSSLYTGMLELANASQVAIIGGNICEAIEVSITITVLGNSRQNILKRSTARPGDKIAVTGYLGSAAAGLQMLNHGLRFNQEITAYLREAFLRPRPRVAEGQLLVKRGVATAIDISDGLLADLRHICESSRVSARVKADLLPVHSAVKENFSDRLLKLALAGGEDYELLFTAREEIVNRIKQEAQIPITIIGNIVEGKPGDIDVFDATGKPINLREMGWEHFKAE